MKLYTGYKVSCIHLCQPAALWVHGWQVIMTTVQKVHETNLMVAQDFYLILDPYARTAVKLFIRPSHGSNGRWLNLNLVVPKTFMWTEDPK